MCNAIEALNTAQGFENRVDQYVSIEELRPVLEWERQIVAQRKCGHEFEMKRFAWE